MPNSKIDLDLTEIHFDTFCKVGGTPQMLHALIAAQEDDVRRWSSCPSFLPFIRKLFFQSKDVSRLGPIHPTGCLSFENSGHPNNNCVLRTAETPVDRAAAFMLYSPPDGELHIPISKILAKFYEYGQYELHKVRMAIRFDNKTIKYVDVQAFPSENFPEARNKDQLKKFSIFESVDDRYDALYCGRNSLKLKTQTAFEEHLEIIENRMRDNGYYIEIHVPDEVIASEVKQLKRVASDSKFGSFNLGAYMDSTYFLPLIESAVFGTIENGEFAVFESDDDGNIHLRRNHRIDDRFLSKRRLK
ncbi:hypothetical protein FPRO04_01284 [Fusarium proliferatum]|nr:hypothetical protein FPRO03_09359 [Fusarium proliferatum]KAG4276786.1 hypothetical protein FPRO04_01284 [Fusarium proliferatum]